MTGETFSHYRIVEKISEGGMGVVYKAEDLTLKRPVALKFIIATAMETEAKKADLILEAQAAAAVNHPNVCTIYEINEWKNEQGEERLFIAMEYIEGENLKDRIKSGPVPLIQAVDIAIQIAEGLKEIHDKGMVHRDIKSDNIRVTDQNRVKIMDFGLVKPAQVRDALREDHSTGGTIAYMSPEQIRGAKVDHRTDIWSLGVVFYEMITGKLPFKKEKEEQALIYAILDEEPESLREAIPDLPSSCIRILDRALEKSVEYRYPSVKEMLSDLKHLKKKLAGKDTELPNKARPTVSGQPASKRKMNRLPVYAIAILFCFLAVIFLLRYAKHRSVPEPTITVLTSNQAMEDYPSLSPDGSKLAYVFKDNIYLKLIGQDSYTGIVTSSAHEYSPVWSPDGNNIAYIRRWGNAPGIYTKPIIGGREIRLHSFSNSLSLFNVDIRPELDWSWDGQWLLFNELDTAEGKHCLFRLDVKTLGKEQLTFPSSGYQGDMNGRFSPDGKKIAFQRIYGYNKSDLFLLELETGDITQLTTDRKNISGLAWMPDGKELIFNSNSEGISRLWSYSFKRKKTEPFPTGGMDANRVSIARSGRRIAYSTHLHKSDIYEAALPDQRPAKIEPNELIASSRGDFFGKCSPDGKKIVFSSNRTGTEEIWVCDIDGSDPVQLTFLKVHSAVPYWSPDSRQIVFESNGDILLVDAEGRTHPRVLVDDPSDERIPGWSHDGKWVYFGSNRSGEYQAYRIYLESGKIEQLTHTSAFTGRESADGKYAYFECRDHDSIIYRVNLSTLMEEPAVIENVSNLIWTVGEEGVYYLKQMGEYTELKLYRHATGTTELVGTLDPGYSLTYVSETLGKILFYTSFGSADIYLVEDF